jgi:hypothetical protein
MKTDVKGCFVFSVLLGGLAAFIQHAKHNLESQIKSLLKKAKRYENSSVNYTIRITKINNFISIKKEKNIVIKTSQQ